MSLEWVTKSPITLQRLEAPLCENVFFDQAEGQPYLQVDSTNFPPTRIVPRHWHKQAIEDLSRHGLP